MKKSTKTKCPPLVIIEIYTQPPLSLVVIFPYAPPPPLWFPNSHLQVIIAQSLNPAVVLVVSSIFPISAMFFFIPRRECNILGHIDQPKFKNSFLILAINNLFSSELIYWKTTGEAVTQLTTFHRCLRLQRTIFGSNFLRNAKI